MKFAKNLSNFAFFVNFGKNPIFLSSFPLFWTLPPFLYTFFGSLGVQKRGTTGVSRIKLSLLYKVVLYKNFILHVYCVVSNPLPASKGHIQLVSIIFENMRVVVIRFFSGRTTFFVSCNHFRIDLGGLKLFLLLYNQPDLFRRSLFF